LTSLLWVYKVFRRKDLPVQKTALVAFSLFAALSLVRADTLISPASEVTTTFPLDGDFQVPVSIYDVPASFMEVDFDVSWDSSILQLDGVEPGTFLSNSFFEPGTINNTAGTDTRVQHAVSPFGHGASGSGTLAVLFFRPIAVGDSDVTLSNVHLYLPIRSQQHRAR
jgi:hypothetical protein